jgi:hypothetical protein
MTTTEVKIENIATLCIKDFLYTSNLSHTGTTQGHNSMDMLYARDFPKITSE